jgi:hypothetical protein
VKWMTVCMCSPSLLQLLLQQRHSPAGLTYFICPSDHGQQVLGFRA